MHELKATPGPWVWNEDRFHGGWTGLFGANDLPVIYPQRENDGDEGAAWFSSDGDAGEEGLSGADRNLIAAAPELFEALAELDEAYCRAGSGLTRKERLEDRQRLIRARAALAKARGEMP